MHNIQHNSVTFTQHYLALIYVQCACVQQLAFSVSFCVFNLSDLPRTDFVVLF